MEVKISSRQSYSFGWLPDFPDYRDYTRNTREVQAILKSAHRTDKPATAVDLREWCSPVENQGNLGSCTAHAGVGLIEYYERKSFGRHLDASRLFLYKVTRNLMKVKGDTGAFIRSTIGAMVLFGVPPEEYWPYTDESDAFDREPPAFCYAFAQNYQTILYFRHDAT
ncbi:MAG TPA: cysteine protease, partial [bacterium]|nr:cysteine protease [bacterium]